MRNERQEEMGGGVCRLTAAAVSHYAALIYSATEPDSFHAAGISCFNIRTAIQQNSELVG